MDYSTLVSKVLSNQCFARVIDDLAKKNCLNLIADDWTERLENNVIYQDYSSAKSMWKQSFVTEKYVYDRSKSPDFNVLIAACCKFVKPYSDRYCKPSVVVLNSEPLCKIARAMTSDLGTQIQLAGDFKFEFDLCSTLTCKECIAAVSEFRKHGMRVAKICEPCIQYTKVYDGNEVVNRFHSMMEAAFKYNAFLAILKLKIDRRYAVFGSDKKRVFRITGNILDIVGFGQRKLESPRTVNIGTLYPMDGCEELDNLVAVAKRTQKTKVIEKDDFRNLLKLTAEESENVTLADEDAAAFFTNTRKRKFEAEDNDDAATIEYLSID